MKFMSNLKMNFIFISEDIRRYAMLDPNEILNEVFLKDLLIREEIGIYSRS